MVNKKTLWEHIEHGLTRLADRGYQIQKENREWQEDNISLGLIPDEEKVRMLKGDLYRKVRADGDVKDLVSAIAILENSIHREFQRNNTVEAVAARFVTSLFFVGFVAVTLSFPISWGCGESQALFCRNAKLLSNSVKSEFKEPPKPIKVLPLNKLN